MWAIAIDEAIRFQSQLDTIVAHDRFFGHCAGQNHLAGVVVIGDLIGIDGRRGRFITGRAQAEEGDDDQPAPLFWMVVQKHGRQQRPQANGQPHP
jgi:hypothetical protein